MSTGLFEIRMSKSSRLHVWNRKATPCLLHGVRIQRRKHCETSLLQSWGNATLVRVFSRSLKTSVVENELWKTSCFEFRYTEDPMLKTWRGKIRFFEIDQREATSLDVECTVTSFFELRSTETSVFERWISEKTTLMKQLKVCDTEAGSP